MTVEKSWGAACCGATAVAPSILSGDDAAQLSSSFGYARGMGYAPPEGPSIFRNDSDAEQILNFRMEGAVLLFDQWQAGMGFPIVHRARDNSIVSENATGIGDITLDVAYEILPEWTYSVWKPHVYLYGQFTLPSGTSIYEAESLLGVDGIGKGFFSCSAGALALRSWGNWDANLLLEFHRSLSRSFTSNQGTTFANPGWGSSGTLGAGYNFGAFRIGGNLTYSYEDPIETESLGIDSVASYQFVWSPAVTLSYLPSADWSVSLTYSDQTLLGSAVNVALNRSASLLLQKRWGR